MVMGSGRTSVVGRRKLSFGRKMMVQVWWHAKGCSISNLEGLLAVVIPFLHRYLFSFAVMSRNSYEYSIGEINIQSTYLCPENLGDSLLFLILLTGLSKS